MNNDDLEAAKRLWEHLLPIDREVVVFDPAVAAYYLGPNGVEVITHKDLYVDRDFQRVKVIEAPKSYAVTDFFDFKARNRHERRAAAKGHLRGD